MLPIKFATFLKAPLATASYFCSGGCVIIVSVSNIRYISNKSIKVKVWSIAWFCIHSKIMPDLVACNCCSWFWNMVSFRYVLVFLNFFNFAFCVTNSFHTIKFYKYLLSLNTFYYWWGFYFKRTQWNLNPKVKYFMFHEMPPKLYFMKCSERNVLQFIFVFRLFKEENLKAELFVVLPLIIAKKLQRYYRFLIIWVSVYGMSLDLANAALLVCCLCIYFVRATVF